MDVGKIIGELRAERDGLDEAILALQRLGQQSGAKRRGRPPAWMKKVEAVQAEPKRRGRPPSSKTKRRNAVKKAEEASE